MPWNGSGATVAPAAVLRSESLSHASVYSRKSRVQPGESGGAAAATNGRVGASPGAMITNTSLAAGHHENNTPALEDTTAHSPPRTFQRKYFLHAPTGAATP